MTPKPRRRTNRRRNRRQSILPNRRLMPPRLSRRSPPCGQRCLGAWCAIRLGWWRSRVTCRTAGMAASRPRTPHPLARRRQPAAIPRAATHLAATRGIPDELSVVQRQPGRGRLASNHAGHRLGPVDVSLEAKRFRHRTIATHQVPVGNIVAAGPGQQRAQPQQRDLAHSRTVIAGRFANRSIASWASARSPSAPRSSSVSTRTPVPQTAYPSRPSWCNSSTARRITGMAASRSPPLALSRAADSSVIGNEGGNTLALPLAGLRHQLQPAVTVGRGVPIQQRDTQRVLGESQCEIVCWPSGRSAPPPRIARKASSSARSTP